MPYTKTTHRKQHKISIQKTNDRLPEMGLEMTNSPISSKHKQLRMLVKIIAFLILLGFAYRICFSGYVDQVPSVLEINEGGSILSPPTEVVPGNFTFSGQVPVNDDHGPRICDIFSGEWVRDSTGPQYTYKSCDTIQHHQNCLQNGRPDSGYIYWRWQPRDCELPRFNPRRFLDLMRKKSMAFIGDSISRNHLESLLCILSQVEQPVQVYHDEEYRNKRWLFESHEFTLSLIWSPFLTEAKIFEDNDGHSLGAVRLHLDEPASDWVNEFSNFDYIEIAAGKWFLKTAVYYENNTIVGCHNCKKENITQLGFYYAYRRALQTTLDFITKSDHKVYTLFRTTTPDHFENGEWDTGGYCNRTVPFKEGEIELRDVDSLMREIELEEFKKAVEETKQSRKGSTLKLFDTTSLALLRPDGHPGPYRVIHPFEGNDGSTNVQNDCLHWCLPGPIDSWNDLLMSIIF